MSANTVTQESPVQRQSTAASAVTACRVQPYLFFGGRCEEAIDYYRRVLGAEVTALMRFKDNPDKENCPMPVEDDRIMHASFRIGETELMASDGCDEAAKFDGFFLSLALPDVDEAGRVFAALGEGGRMLQPLMPTFFAKAFGMVADRFGVSWMVIVPARPPA